MQQWRDPARRPPVWKWSVLALVLMLVLAAVFVFLLNRFTLTLELSGGEEVFCEYSETYREPGVIPVLKGTLLFRDGITPDVKIETVGRIDECKLGLQTVTYRTSFLWLKAEAVRTVRVMDTKCPVITLHTNREHPYVPGEPYIEEGYTATDNYDGDITHRVVRVEHLGLVTYAVLDSSGNPAYAEREIPEYDYKAPELTLEGYRDVTITAGTRYEDPGCTAWDNVDGDLTAQIQTEGTVTWYKKGTYTITYTVTDSYGNTASCQRIVKVTPRPRQDVVDPGNRVIYLTFDDGPGPYTEELLDLLDSYDVQATFFVIDNSYRHLLKEIAERGHSIGIHSVSHSYRTIYSSVDAFFDDLYGMQKIIEEETGAKTWLMRFPGGSSNTVSRFNPGIMTTLTAAVEEAGFHYFDWNVDSDDAGRARSADTVYRNVTGGIVRQGASIVLQHDIHRYSVDAVEKILIWGFENGYTFLPLREDSPPVHHELNN